MVGHVVCGFCLYAVQVLSDSGSEWSHGLPDICFVAFRAFYDIYHSFVHTGDWFFEFGN